MRNVLIRPVDVARGCAAAIFVLVSLHVASQVARFGFGRDYQMGLADKVYLGAESSIPNWFSTLLLFTCAVVLFAIAGAGRREGAGYWRTLGFIFTALSIDEAAALHDLASPFFAGVFEWLATAVGGPFIALARKPNYAWEIPAVAFVITVAAAFVPFLRRLPQRTRRGFLVAGLLYIGGALAVDFLEGWYSGLHGPKNPTFVAMLTVEETLEMAGVTVFLYTLLCHAEAELGALQIRLDGSS